MQKTAWATFENILVSAGTNQTLDIFIPKDVVLTHVNFGGNDSCPPIFIRATIRIGGKTGPVVWSRHGYYYTPDGNQIGLVHQRLDLEPLIGNTRGLGLFLQAKFFNLTDSNVTFSLMAGGYTHD